jgi:nicotinate-nucleotide pyrophosphorylase (carboxylating)
VQRFDPLIESALAEDIGREDITTNAVIDADATWSGTIVARENGVIAGLPVAQRVFALVDSQITWTPLVQDGACVAGGTRLAELRGPARGLLTGERVALNFLGRLSGIATLTRRYVEAVGTLRARITDTRKTTPGLRVLERYAVRAGGGANHRLRLVDAVLIKDNHLAAAGSVGQAVERARAHSPSGTIVEVECDTLEQVSDAIAAGADAVLLDNMDDATMERAVCMARGAAIVEASGGMTIERAAAAARAGVDVISVGALTHSARALDVALDFAPMPEKG